MKEGDVINFAGLGFTVKEGIFSNYINSPGGIKLLKSRIKNLIKRHGMDYLLLEIHESLLQKRYPDYPDFVFVKLVEFIMRYSKIKNKPTQISNRDFLEPLRMTAEYSLDEISIKKRDKTKPSDEEIASFLLRMIGTQSRWDYAINNRFPFYRTVFLYDELVKDIRSPKFVRDIIETKFQKEFGVSIIDFIKIGFVLFSGSSRPSGLSRAYLEEARKQRMPIPEDKVIKLVLEQVTCDKKRFKNDEDFIKSNLIPLLKYPLIRPWKNSDLEKPDMDRFIAPIPDLVLYRFTAGLYFQLWNLYKLDFTTAFGDLFELYVNELLSWYKLPNKIIDEKEIGSFYAGKKPDWVIFDNSGVILIECKATQYTQSMYEYGIEASNKGCISQLQKAIRQLDDFQSQIPELSSRYGVINKGLPIQKIIVTYEPLFGLEEGPLRNIIDDKDDWSVVGVWELEAIQPYIAKGANFWEYLQERKNVSFQEFDKIFDNMEAETGANKSENELLKYGERIFDELMKNRYLLGDEI
jgi:hypothetical protein